MNISVNFFTSRVSWTWYSQCILKLSTVLKTKLKLTSALYLPLIPFDQKKCSAGETSSFGPNQPPDTIACVRLAFFFFFFKKSNQSQTDDESQKLEITLRPADRLIEGFITKLLCNCVLGLITNSSSPSIAFTFERNCRKYHWDT